MSLTPKQAAFVAEYLVDLNATQAAIRAGYSPKTAGAIGGENLQKPEIAEAITAAQEERERRVEVTQDIVVEGLLEEARRVEKGSSHSARVSAWSWIGRHLGMFKDKVEHEHRGSIETGVSKLSDEELAGPDPLTAGTYCHSVGALFLLEAQETRARGGRGMSVEPKLPTTARRCSSVPLRYRPVDRLRGALWQ